MRTLYVVTHPEATHHVDKLVGGQYDSDLTDRGEHHARRIAAAVADRTLDAPQRDIITSDLLRTRRTAEVIASRLDVDVTLEPRLREKSYGAAEGRPQTWLDERFVPPPALGERLRHDEGLPGAETKWDLAVRVYAAMDEILRSPTQHQIVVTHGMAATFVLSAWIAMPLEAAGQTAFRFTSGGITTLVEDDFYHNRTIYELNNVAHLSD